MIILNKFPLEPGHVMAISREFRQQQSLLDVEDWQAIATVLAEIDVLVMFNGGKPAGASQDHRHIHFMPGRKASLEPLFLDLAVSPDPQRVPAFNFPHVLVRLDGAAAIEAGAEPAALAEELDVAFRRAAQALGLKSGGPDQLSSSYNILMTRRWMLVVPRRENAFEGEGVRISLAAVHYGGLIMVREREQLEVVRKVGLHTILAAGAGLAA